MCATSNLSLQQICHSCTTCELKDLFRILLVIATPVVFLRVMKMQGFVSHAIGTNVPFLCNSWSSVCYLLATATDDVFFANHANSRIVHYILFNTVTNCLSCKSCNLQHVFHKSCTLKDMKRATSYRTNVPFLQVMSIQFVPNVAFLQVISTQRSVSHPTCCCNKCVFLASL